MAPEHPTARHSAAIYNAAYHVRAQSRGGRWSSASRAAELRREAIRELGLAVRAAFSASEDFEPLVVAFFDGLNHRDDWPRF